MNICEYTKLAYIEYSNFSEGKYKRGDHVKWKGYEACIVEEKNFHLVINPLCPRTMPGMYYIVFIYDNKFKNIGFYAKEEDLEDLSHPNTLGDWSNCIWRPND